MLEGCVTPLYFQGWHLSDSGGGKHGRVVAQLVPAIAKRCPG